MEEIRVKIWTKSDESERVIKIIEKELTFPQCRYFVKIKLINVLMTFAKKQKIKKDFFFLSSP